MGRLKRLFVCSECGRPSAQWAGKCAACGSWGSVSEHPAGSSRGSLRSINGARGDPRVSVLLPDLEERRIGTGLPGVDRVLGGGLVPGSVVLLAGAPGIGKSTLLLQLASGLSCAGSPCLLASGEESVGQVAARAHRLGIDGTTLRCVPGRDLDEVMEAARGESPAVLMVDSVQTIRDAASESLAGGTGQVRACADALIGLAKEQGVSVILIGHVTKDGELAGPRTLEHAVDVVLTFEGDPRSGLRILAAGKNRFGPEGEVAWFEMTGAGVIERAAVPRLGEADAEPGSATAIALAGRRAFAVDVQALVAAADGPPRRQVAGLDARRFHIVAAVVDRALGLRLIRAELFGASAGGIRLDDPGTDLAVAAALVSSATGILPPPGTGFVGELSLTGSLRPVAGTEQRISAAAAAGITRLVCPAGSAGPRRGDRAGGVEVVPARHVRDALGWALGGGGRERLSRVGTPGRPSATGPGSRSLVS